jgi:hypothetical protein
MRGYDDLGGPTYGTVGAVFLVQHAGTHLNDPDSPLVADAANGALPSEFDGAWLSFSDALGAKNTVNAVGIENAAHQACDDTLGLTGDTYTPVVHVATGGVASAAGAGGGSNVSDTGGSPTYHGDAAPVPLGRVPGWLWHSLGWSPHTMVTSATTNHNYLAFCGAAMYTMAYTMTAGGTTKQLNNRFAPWPGLRYYLDKEAPSVQGSGPSAAKTWLLGTSIAGPPYEQDCIGYTLPG